MLFGASLEGSLEFVLGWQAEGEARGFEGGGWLVGQRGEGLSRSRHRRHRSFCFCIVRGGDRLHAEALERVLLLQNHFISDCQLRNDLSLFSEAKSDLVSSIVRAIVIVQVLQQRRELAFFKMLIFILLPQ